MIITDALVGTAFSCIIQNSFFQALTEGKMGIACSGLCGTGKTESIKDIARRCGVDTLTVCCSD